MNDRIKLALALLLVVAGVAAFNALSEHAMVLRVLAVIAGLALAVAAMWTTAMGRQALAFTQESIAEARRVVWPTRKETIQTTVTVFVLVMIMALFLWAVDFGMTMVVRFLMGRSA
jgi:preprotein translocase subunit SecE